MIGMQIMIKSVYYQMKGISYFVWIPPIVLYILLPAVHYMVYLKSNDMSEVYSNILKNAQYFIPLLSVWLILFVLYHFVEQSGCELLYVTETIKMHYIILVSLLFDILMLPLFVGYTYFFPEYWWLYIKLCVINLMYASFAYVLTYVLQRIIPTILWLLFYSSIGLWGDSNGIGIISYYTFDLMVGRMLFDELIPFMFTTIIAFFWGGIANYRFSQKGLGQKV